MTTQPPTLTSDPDKVTPAIAESLEEFHKLTLCPICDSVLVDPVVLTTCGHTFCTACIKRHTTKSFASTCSVPKCSRAVSLPADGSSHFKKNPNISTVVPSFGRMCKAINEAPPKWFESPLLDDLKRSGEGMDDLQANESQQPESSVLPSEDEGGDTIIEENLPKVFPTRGELLLSAMKKPEHATLDPLVMIRQMHW